MHLVEVAAEIHARKRSVPAHHVVRGVVSGAINCRLVSVSGLEGLDAEAYVRWLCDVVVGILCHDVGILGRIAVFGWLRLGWIAL